MKHYIGISKLQGSWHFKNSQAQVLVKIINHIHITEKVFSDKRKNVTFLQAVGKWTKPQCNRRF